MDILEMLVDSYVKILDISKKAEMQEQELNEWIFKLKTFVFNLKVNGTPKQIQWTKQIQYNNISDFIRNYLVRI